MKKRCTRRRFLSSITLVAGASLLSGGWIRTLQRQGKVIPYSDASEAGTSGSGTPCISTIDKVPPPSAIEFTVQYPGKNPVTLRGHYWYNREAVAQGGKFPAIVEINPYRCFDDTFVKDSSFYPWFAYNGYLCFRVDLQGSGNSDGLLTDEYTDEELVYCTQVISQIANHPRCNGNVGMMGWSWSAINSLMVAARDDCPAALKAVLVICGTDDRYNNDIHYFDGAMIKDNVTWAASMWGWLTRPPDPLVVGDRWQAMWRERIRNANFWFKYWGNHQARDSYWSDTSVRNHYDRVKVPVNIVSGYQDVSYCSPVPRVVAGLAAQGKPVEGLIGPWGHSSPHEGCPGPQIDWLPHLLTNWAGKWLKGVPPAEEWPQLVVWLNESKEPDHSPATPEIGRWVAEDGDWPSRVVEKLFYLSENQQLSPTEPQAASSAATSAHLILATEMLETGSWGSCSIEDLPGDQSNADRQSVVFDSEPLTEDMDCFGYPEVKLNLACDKPLSCLAVRLCEVIPATGTSHLVSYRFFNLCYRDGDLAKPRPLTPGEVFQVRIPLNVLGHTFKKGWKIRLSLSTSFFPTMWPTPEIAVATVYTGPLATLSAGTLSLPLRRPREADNHMPAVFTTNPPITCVNPDDYITSVQKGRAGMTKDLVEPITEGSKNGVIVRYIEDYGQYEYGGPLQNLYVDGLAEQRIQIFADDPLSLVASSSYTLILDRITGSGEWKVKSQTSTTVWAQKGAGGRLGFRYQAVIETFMADGSGGYIPFEKRIDQGFITPVAYIAPIMELLME